MKVTCDNCGAVYRIPETKLTKEVSRATCKKCGNKIVIRKPSGSLGDGGLGSSYAYEDDDDAIVNHEERTVIATVPELQRFDATPPLSVPGSTPDGHDDDDTDLDDGTDTSGQVGSAPAAPAAASAQPAAAKAMDNPSMPRPSGVPIPSQMRLEVGIAPVILTVLSIIGTLLFIRDLNNWVWSNSISTAIGFGLALYGQVAALMALLDLRAQRAPRPQMVFGVPAAVCVMVFLLLLMIQGRDEMAFLDKSKPGVAKLIDAQTDALAGVDYEDVVVVDEKTGQRRTERRRRQPKRDQLPTSSGGDPMGLMDGTAIAAIDATGPKLDGSMALALGTGGDRSAGPENRMAQGVKLHDDGLSHSKAMGLINNDSGVRRCVSEFSPRGTQFYEVTILPSGKVKDAHFAKSSTYLYSGLEKCLNEAVAKLQFPTFPGDTPEVVSHKFLF